MPYDTWYKPAEVRCRFERLKAVTNSPSRGLVNRAFYLIPMCPRIVGLACQGKPLTLASQRICDRVGVIHEHDGVHVFPDHHAQDAKAGRHLYNVRFAASALWGENAIAGVGRFPSRGRQVRLLVAAQRTHDKGHQDRGGASGSPRARRVDMRFVFLPSPPGARRFRSRVCRVRCRQRYAGGKR